MRRPKPWYRKFNDTWYVQIAGRQMPLAKGKANREAAHHRFDELSSSRTWSTSPMSRS